MTKKPANAPGHLRTHGPSVQLADAAVRANKAASKSRKAEKVMREVTALGLSWKKK